MHRPNDLLMGSTQRDCTLLVVLQAALAEAQKATQTAEANLLAECYARSNDQVKYCVLCLLLYSIDVQTLDQLLSPSRLRCRTFKLLLYIGETSSTHSEAWVNDGQER